ncbi:MAG: hypothetical protein KDK78_01300, partial [Chlamydiia bacterium]|nr:hypothetical protein [Chlamydiia bacterium]
MKIDPDANGGILSLLDSANRASEPHRTQDKIERLRAALLHPNTEPLDFEQLESLRVRLSEDADIDPALRILTPLVALRVSKDSEALIQALASLKNSHDATSINELLALGLEIPSTDLRNLARAAGIDLSGYQFLTNIGGRLITVLDKSSGEDSQELVMMGNDSSAYRHLSRGSPAVVACLVNHFRILLSNLIRGGFAEEKLEKSLPLIRYCDLRGIDSTKQAEWLFKTNPSKLTHLIISSSPIAELPAKMPLLQVLKCHNCPALRTLPAELPQLQILHCINCKVLASLPEELPLLELLDCYGCAVLSALPAKMPVLRKLRCAACVKLNTLPSELPLLQKLDCHSCMALPTIQTEMPLLEKLFCPHCTVLSALPAELPLLQKLACGNCPQLQALPAALPFCLELDCHECPQLANVMLPELPWNAHVISGQIDSSFHNLDISLHTLKQAPLRFLLELGEDYLLQNQPFPNISYVDINGESSMAVDAGGVRRDFVSTLLENLFTESEDPERLHRHNGIPVVAGLENEETAYRSLGRLLALCYQRTAAGFVAGPLFASSFYRALAVYPHNVHVALALLDLPADVADILDGQNTASDAAYARAYHLVLSYIASDMKHRAYFAEPQHRGKLAEQLMLSMGDPSIQRRYQALRWIAEEMKYGLGEAKWAALQARPYNEIQECIEGSLDKAQIKRVLQWTNYG